MTMLKLILLEIKALFRRPVWILLAAFTAWSSYMYLPGAPGAPLGLEFHFMGADRSLLSFGQWGRSLLLMLNLFLGVVFSLFIALITVRACVPELVHREALWSTPRSGRIAAATMMAISLATTALIAISSTVVFLNPYTRELLVACQLCNVVK